MGSVIAVDARAAAEVPAGRGRYVRELLTALADLPEAVSHRFLLYARRPCMELALDARFEWRIVPLPDPLWHLAFAVAASRTACVVLSTNSYLTAWGTWKPTAVVVHDLVSFVEGARAQSRAARIERVTIRPALRRADALPCVSHATRRDLIARFPHVAAKALTIPLAASDRFGEPVDAERVRASHGLRCRYVLAVGTLEPRKNLERLLAAWTALPLTVRDAHTLALVGPRGWDDEGIVRGARKVGAHRLGWVSDDDLRALYAGCSAFAYPSLYEGFGLPVLEAMAAGAPVVTSNVSSLPEVADHAALLVDPLDTVAITQALERVLTDSALAGELRRRGRERARAFSWERTARETLTLLLRLADGEARAAAD